MGDSLLRAAGKPRKSGQQCIQNGTVFKRLLVMMGMASSESVIRPARGRCFVYSIDLLIRVDVNRKDKKYSRCR